MTKLTSVSKPIVDLSDNPSTNIVTKLKKGDVVLHEGNEYSVSVPPKKIRRDTWLLGVRDNDGTPDYIRILDVEKQKMTAHEKKVMVNNISSIVEENEGDDEFLLELIERYHYNLAVHNRYSDEDVRECMAKFPKELLVKSGVAI